ncbi:UDP-2,3-diacylglucosamine diphosphatase LpxI domain-containing protein [Methyloraptor flagellatus]|uniref:UDP-2,3-diacylglucosamine diphosphatase LpxI n=1 Tax=Methyloraptor flagellatus TaxID=3162530 RepID=A0AAU7XF37_9HYPH
MRLGRRDKGQGVVVAAGRVVAEEGPDGTDAMLARVAAAGTAQGGVLVKAMKPTQDPRLDLPAIGPDTVANAHAAGLAGVAVETGRAIVAHRGATIAAADAAALFVYGTAGDGEASGSAGRHGPEAGEGAP